MRFKVDENLPVEVADSLRQAGYDTATVITLDTDFADIRAYPPE
jgi:predicted nuclease of predicted toxin-antitoxin system